MIPSAAVPSPSLRSRLGRFAIALPLVGGIFAALKRALERRQRWPLTQALRRARHWYAWNVSSNPDSRRRFRRAAAVLTAPERETAAQLTERGIALTRWDALGVDARQWGAVAEIGRRFRRDVEEISSLDDAGLRAMAPDHPFAHNAGKVRRYLRGEAPPAGEDYILKLLPEGSSLSRQHPLVALGLSGPILSVVNAYMGLWSKLIYADMWHTMPGQAGDRIGSQRWHRDPDDRRITKVYLFLAEIPEAAGPMEYLPGSRPDERAGSLPEWRAAGGHHYLADGVDLPESTRASLVRCMGPEGTLVFCDTTGFHRGGISSGPPRIVATWTFVSPAALFPRRFSLADAADPGSAAGYAVQ
jgi:hypothetical protein